MKTEKQEQPDEKPSKEKAPKQSESQNPEKPKSLRLSSTDDIPKSWKSFKAKKSSTVTIRELEVTEQFNLDWSPDPLFGEPGIDLALKPETGNEYPCKKDIFQETYEETEVEGQFRKKGEQTFYRIPKGTVVDEVVTLEGVINNVSGDTSVLAAGSKGEVYPVSLDTFAKNFIAQ